MVQAVLRVAQAVLRVAQAVLRVAPGGPPCGPDTNYIVLRADINAHSPLWGGTGSNAMGTRGSYFTGQHHNKRNKRSVHNEQEHKNINDITMGTHTQREAILSKTGRSQTHTY